VTVVQRILLSIQPSIILKVPIRDCYSQCGGAKHTNHLSGIPRTGFSVPGCCSQRWPYWQINAIPFDRSI